ncbi:MAG: outer membrane beta-barrel protein [Ignavibacteriales bacterium]|nr:outer membrane beta-barrel protein [Ignavibacteriales bacterium]
MKISQAKIFSIILFIILLLNASTLQSQEIKRIQPEWWFGGSLGINFNFYNGSFHRINESNDYVTSFKKGSGVGLYLAPLLEYHPDPVWGGMLQLGFDARGGDFDDVKDTSSLLSLGASINYLTLEPSVRVSPFKYPLYFFGGPRLGFNIAKSFSLKKTPGTTAEGDFSNIRGTVIGGQLGAGYDFSLTGLENRWQIIASPFLALHFGQGPSSDVDWSLTTVRVGVSVKFGNTEEIKNKVEREVQFSVRAPKIIPNERKVRETFPMRNYIFFDAGSAVIPDRYVRLTNAQAEEFNEQQLLQPEPKDLTGRSRRQLTVYHNILNILGDRLRKYPDTKITLIGSSEEGISNAEELAYSIKRYLIQIFNISEERIIVKGVPKPAIPSVLPGATKELSLLVPEDMRVEITSASTELLEPVQIISLQEEPLDSDVLFSVANAEDYFASWSVVVTDDNNKITRFGPYTSHQERISGKIILGSKTKGNYKVAMEGQTSDGQVVRKEETMKLIRSDEPEEAPGYRFSILFEFDQSKTVATYQRFLAQQVVPLIPEGSSVIIHGHTDIIGEESHNLILSQNRAQETMNIIGQELAKIKKGKVKFDTYGFGEDIRRAPFNNDLPEERFYNRTVIIDIVPE